MSKVSCLQGHRAGHERPQYERADEEGHRPGGGPHNPDEIAQGVQLIRSPASHQTTCKQTVTSYVIRSLAKHLYNTVQIRRDVYWNPIIL